MLGLDSLSVSVSELELFWSFNPSGIGVELHGRRVDGDDGFVASQEDLLTGLSGKVHCSENGVPRWDMVCIFNIHIEPAHMSQELYSYTGPNKIDFIGYQVGTAGSGAGVVGEWCYVDPDEPAALLHGQYTHFPPISSKTLSLRILRLLLDVENSKSVKDVGYTFRHSLKLTFFVSQTCTLYKRYPPLVLCPRSCTPITCATKYNDSKGVQRKSQRP